VLTGAGGAPFNSWALPYAEGDKVVGDYHKEGENGYVLVTVDAPHVKMRWKSLSTVNGKDDWAVEDTLEYTVN